MRGRDRILANLEELYRGEFERANAGEEPARMAELDFGFQRDQIFLEALLDLRDLLSALPTASAKGARRRLTIRDELATALDLYQPGTHGPNNRETHP